MQLIGIEVSCLPHRKKETTSRKIISESRSEDELCCYQLTQVFYYTKNHTKARIGLEKHLQNANLQIRRHLLSNLTTTNRNSSMGNFFSGG